MSSTTFGLFHVTRSKRTTMFNGRIQGWTRPPGKSSVGTGTLHLSAATVNVNCRWLQNLIQTIYFGIDRREGVCRQCCYCILKTE